MSARAAVAGETRIQRELATLAARTAPACEAAALEAEHSVQHVVLDIRAQFREREGRSVAQFIASAVDSAGFRQLASPVSTQRAVASEGSDRFIIRRDLFVVSSVPQKGLHRAAEVVEARILTTFATAWMTRTSVRVTPRSPSDVSDALVEGRPCTGRRVLVVEIDARTG